MSESSQIANARLGIRLFLIYSVFYFGFVLVNAFAAEWSEIAVLPGINLAVLWGFALIGLAFLLAMIYGLGCRSEEHDPLLASQADGLRDSHRSEINTTDVDGKGANQ